jgi:hypothetical protein
MFSGMDILPPFLRFAPVPLRKQHNGWSPARQHRFIIALARGAGPGEAARSLGKTRQSAYDLRKRPGAEEFAAAWDAALAFAQEVRVVQTAPAAGMAGVETLLVPRYYRGRLIGFVQREDVHGAMRLLGRLDRLTESICASGLHAQDERMEAFARLTGIDTSDKKRV